MPSPPLPPPKPSRSPPPPPPRPPHLTTFGEVVIRDAVGTAVARLDQTTVGDKLVSDGKAYWYFEPKSQRNVLVDRATGQRLAFPGQTRPIEKPGSVRPPPQPDPSSQSIAQALTTQEHFADHIYKDNEGNLTVGIGYLLPNVDAALDPQLQWYDRKTGKALGRTPSDLQRIRNEFAAVKKVKQSNFSAAYFKKFSGIYITRKNAEALLNKKISESQKEVLQIYDEFQSYPFPAKLAIFDMIYGLGRHKLEYVYKDFTKAVRSRDWKLAAQNSNRKNAHADRNDIVKQWLLQAYDQDSFRRPDSGMQYLSIGVLIK